MRVLIDECLPRQLKGWLARYFDTSTVQEMGWANVKNGKLLLAANENGFDVLVTADKNMHYQQNFDGLQISSVVIPTNVKAVSPKMHTRPAAIIRKSSARTEGGYGAWG